MLLFKSINTTELNILHGTKLAKIYRFSYEDFHMYIYIRKSYILYYIYGIRYKIYTYIYYIAYIRKSRTDFCLRKRVKISSLSHDRLIRPCWFSFLFLFSFLFWFQAHLSSRLLILVNSTSNDRWIRCSVSHVALIAEMKRPAGRLFFSRYFGWTSLVYSDYHSL